MLVPGTAVLLDTETTDLDGVMCEVAVIDTDGTVLLNTLVDPGVPITAAAAAVHGITDQDLLGAPTTAAVLAELVQVIGDRKVLALPARVSSPRRRRGWPSGQRARRRRPPSARRRCAARCIHARTAKRPGLVRTPSMGPARSGKCRTVVPLAGKATSVHAAFSLHAPHFIHIEGSCPQARNRTVGALATEPGGAA